MLKPSNKKLKLTKREKELFHFLVIMGGALTELYIPSDKRAWNRLNRAWQAAMKRFDNG